MPDALIVKTECPVDFVRGAMARLAMGGYSRKGGSSAKLSAKMQCFRREEGSL